MEATLKAAVPDAIAQMQWFFDKHPDDPDPCDLARDYNDALRDADQPTPYDP